MGTEHRTHIRQTTSNRLRAPIKPRPKYSGSWIRTRDLTVSDSHTSVTGLTVGMTLAYRLAGSIGMGE